MAGQLKEVRNRIKSVISTQQITKAMKMVSAAKLRRAQDRITQMRPYSQKLSEMLSNIVSAAEGDVNVDLSVAREVKNALVVVMTSDRGLCGAFNTNINKTGLQLIRTKYAALNPKNVHVLCIGKKSAQFFKKYSYTVIETHIELYANLKFDAVALLAEELMAAYTTKQYDAVDMVYSRFKNAATQIFTAEQFLPIAKIEAAQSVVAQPANKSIKADFIFEPTQAEIIETLMPKILKVQLFKGLLDTNASEHGARMTAMDKASENANEILKNLKISYNRARQAAITTELSEIVAGAAALQGA
jgi:F-type H+-transporting ATPase subunit gamma